MTNLKLHTSTRAPLTFLKENQRRFFQNHTSNNKTPTMKKIFFSFSSIALVMAMISFSCKKDDGISSTTTTTNNTTIPDVFKKFNSTVTISTDGTYIILKSNGLPDHKTPYYKNTQWASTMYEAYNGTNTAWSQNPNTIASQNYVFKIPLNPTVSSAHAETPMGPMGISLNGVPLFNQYAAGRVQLTTEINSFDEYNGHPAQAGDYHYHVEPLYLTGKNGKSSLIGFLLDGYPVYGPQENGKTLTNSDLDTYHGHTSATTEYPNGIYHYHITTESPYINGTGFYGTAGTVTN